MTEVTNYFELPMGKLYLLSGLPGSGKSTWTKPLPSTMVVSTDKLREQLTGYRTMGTHKRHYQGANVAVFKVLNQILATRLYEKLTTFVDATLLNDTERGDLVKLAAEHGIQSEILIFDRPLAQCQLQDAQRDAVVSGHRIAALDEVFQRTSAFPYRMVPQGSTPRLNLPSLPNSAIDVVGDVHGLFDEMMAFLETLGYQIKDGVPTHPQGRKLLFLGDVVDRGPKSVEMLQFLRRAVAAGHFAVMGNHEHKLVKFWRSYKEGAPHANSFSASETAMAFLHLPNEERELLIGFLKSLPGYFVFQEGDRKLAFVHANQTCFDPMTVLYSECMYGSEELKNKRGFDSDASYAQSYEAGHSPFWLVRGHVEQTSAQDSVFSLERRQAFSGHLAVLPLDGFLDKCGGLSPRDAFENSIKLHKCEFNFDDHMAKFGLSRALEKLVVDKLAVVSSDVVSGMKLYKYSKRVFFDALWGTSATLSKARGIVLDLAGNIVVHPFDKIFNYGEQDAGRLLTEDHPVIEVEKLNGFLGCVSKHPLKHDLLCTTTGSFDSPFVGYIQSFIDGAQRGRFLKFFSKNDLTLMFEVMHADDPHIIHYAPEEMGLWLIGARGKSQDAPQATEAELDVIATELQLRRPKWINTTFGAVKHKVSTSEIEGYMVRDALTQEPLLKFKTPYYLVTKFLGRMSDKKAKFMFGNPSVFKRDLDEEFYDLVDVLTTRFTCDEFLAMPDSERVVIVRQLIAEMR